MLCIREDGPVSGTCGRGGEREGGGGGEHAGGGGGTQLIS
jgi:hypothetical protein